MYSPAHAAAAATHPLSAGILWNALLELRHKRHQAQEERATRAALSKLSDRELTDIGLARCDIGMIAERAAQR
ncbi:MAG: DUF1127 domain-containing protein [Mangrovicoccus sp.]|nr:DUF1127 domain-containing protein [Mangrovicoccus sp.]